MNHYAEFLGLATAHLLAVASPGPDFAIIIRQSVTYNRRVAVWCAFGLGLGILLHSTYSLLGIGLLLKQYDWLQTIVQIIGAIYLAYLGVLSIQSSSVDASQFDASARKKLPSTLSAIKVGFLTNALNPKATLFILFLFTTAVNEETAMSIKISYGIYMACATFIWFSFIAQIFNAAPVKNFFLRFGFWFDRLLGVILIGLAVKVLFF